MRVLHLRNSDLLGGPERLILDQVALAAEDVRPTVASFARPGAQRYESRRTAGERQRSRHHHVYKLDHLFRL